MLEEELFDFEKNEEEKEVNTEAGKTPISNLVKLYLNSINSKKILT